VSYLPQFKNDVFVSYRRVANETPDRWVDTFCENLRAILRDRVGDVHIWRDVHELKVGDAWRTEIAEALDSAAIFLALINRTYFDSDECRKELDHFLGALKQGRNAEGRLLVPIFKHPAKDDAPIPAELHEINRHEFFVRDERTFRELDAKRDAEEYWERMVRMATDLTEALETLRAGASKKVVGKVFISRVAPELSRDRERLRGALGQRNIMVVPEREYLWNADDNRDRMADDLADVSLCVHLVARTASIDPAVAEHDRIQLEMAHARMKELGRPAPLVWIQPGDHTDDSQRALIDFIEGTLANEHVEYLSGTLQEFEDQVFALLPRPVEEAPAGPVEIVVLTEAGDAAAVAPLKRTFVEGLGAEPRILRFTGTTPENAEKLKAKLASAPRVVIVWDAQDEEWVQDMLDLADLQPAVREKRVAVCITGTSNAEKEGFVTAKARVLTDPAAAAAEWKAFLGSAGA
jgi:hypothetical protein